MRNQNKNLLRFPNIILNWTTYEYFIRKIVWFYSSKFNLVDKVELKENFRIDEYYLPFATILKSNVDNESEIVSMNRQIANLFIPNLNLPTKYDFIYLKKKSQIILGVGEKVKIL